MSVLDRLRYEHNLFRGQLNVFESLMAQGPTDGAAIQQMSGALLKALRSHIRRETRLAVWGSRRLERFGAGELARFAIEHDPELEVLQVIRRCCATRISGSLDALKPSAALLFTWWRRHMDEQEAELFPLLERTLSAETVGAPVPSGAVLWSRMPRGSSWAPVPVRVR
jgi:hemerythrin-like domain-containing protein